MEGAAGAKKFGVLRVSRGKTVILEKNRGFPTQLSVPPLDFGEKWLKGGGHLVGIVLIGWMLVGLFDLTASDLLR